MPTHEELIGFSCFAVQKLMTLFAVERFEVTIKFEPAEDCQVVAWCVNLPGYDKAEVNFDLEQCTSYESMAEAVIHEMLHVLCIPIYNTFEVITVALAPDNPADPACRLIAHAYDQGQELQVAQLQRTLDQLRPNLQGELVDGWARHCEAKASGVS